MTLRIRCLVGCGFLLLLPMLCFCSDWPQWRGPDRDGRIVDAPKTWPEELDRSWQVEVGEGHSSPVIVGKYAYIFTRQADNEVVRRLELGTGKVVWSKKYPVQYKMRSAARGHGKGPKSTPVVAEGKLVTLGISGVLSCYRTDDGEQLWQKDFSRDYPKTSPLYGTAMSPVVHRGTVIAHVGGHNKGALIALDLSTGKQKWSWKEDGPGYASPILINIEGTQQIVTQSQSASIGVDVETGALLWKSPFKTGYDQNSITPILYQGTIILSGYHQPTFAAKLAKQGSQWKFTKTWKNESIPLYMSSPVIQGDLMFGMTERSQGMLFCANPANGEVYWKGKGRMEKNAAILAAGTHVIIQTDNGWLTVIKSSKSSQQTVARYKVSDKATWAHPACTGSHLLIKDQTSLICYRLAQTVSRRR